LCTFFLDKKSTKKIKAMPRRLPHCVTEVYWNYCYKEITGGGTAIGLRFRLFFRATVLLQACFAFFKLFIFLWPENAIPLARMLTLRQCRRASEGVFGEPRNTNSMQ
jgi:hypothetical protein